MLLDERLQQAIQRLHDRGVAVNLVRAVFLDQANALVLDVAGDDPGKRPPQVRRQFMRRQVATQLQAGHVGVGRVERALEALLDFQQPVEVEGIVALAAELLHRLEALGHLPGHLGRVVDDDFIQSLRRLAEGRPDEFVQLPQVRLGAARAGEDDRERQFAVVRVHEDAQQVEELFRRTGTAREDDDAVADTDEGFQALLDVRQDHQFVDDRVRRLGGDDARLGQAQVAAAAHALLGMGDGRALHRPFHHAGTAAGADVQLAQAQFVADFLGVLIFLAADRVAAPAHHQLGLDARTQGAGIAQQLEHVVGDAGGAVEVDLQAVQLAFGVDQVAQGAEEHFTGAGDHFAIDEGIRRGVQQFQAYAAVLLVDTDLEVLVGIEDGLGVVDMRAGIEDGQGALAEKGVDAAGAGLAELLDFTLGKRLQAALGADRSIDYLSWGHSGFHAVRCLRTTVAPLL